MAPPGHGQEPLTPPANLDQRRGPAADIDFRFLEAADVADVTKRAGLTAEARLERASPPGEADTRREYLLGRRRN
jgi:hypothetical protein